VKERLTAIKIKNAGDGKLFDGGGLILVKTGGSGKWVFRFSHLGKRREMGLGAWPVVSLADARALRDRWARVLAAGDDPISIRDAETAEAIAERDREDPTFAELVDLVFEARRDNLRGGGARGRWRSPLDLYMIPALGRKPGSKLTQRDIADALRPIWRKKYPTAVKAIQRTKIVLRSAKRMGFPVDPEIVDSAQEILGVVNHVVQHTPHVAWQDIPDLYAALPDTSGGWCNRWCILTAVRLFPARGAMVSEIEGDVWTVPAQRMKGMVGQVSDFRVPLSDPAMEIVERAREFEQDFLFPGARDGKPITDAAVEKCLREIGAAGTPHGFRTSFRTWAQATAVSFDVAEMALSHIIGNKVVRSYARDDLLDQRRVVMQSWARFVTGQEANVISLRR
jgi:integrase